VKRLVLMAVFVWSSFFASAVSGAEPFEFADGDRVVLIGNTLIEREQRYGYWETAITAHNPKLNITFRNLGWSGDTVFGEAQAGFGKAEDGFKHLVEHVKALKPTVLVMGFGGVEAFEGEKGLARFIKGYNTLIETAASPKTRLIFLSPIELETLGKPLPDLTEQNKNVRLYANAVREIAEKRHGVFIDLVGLIRNLKKGVSNKALTDDGLHFTAYGYWFSSRAIEQGLLLQASNGFMPPPEPGKNTGHPEFDQVEKLRQTIIEKNRLYFHRWRPQNETYLFGFRKHEQGQNAREIPQFDPPIEKLEKEIATLRVPVPHTYEIVPAK
jgi:hypothetical protein